MHQFSFHTLTKKQQYKFLSGSVVPRPIAWITTLKPDGQTVNVAPFSFFNLVSDQVPLFSVTFTRKDGKPKDTAVHLKETGEAVIHIVSEKNTAEMNQTAASLPMTESELSLVDLQLEPSKHVSVPGIKEAAIRFEGKVYQYVPVYNREQTAVVSDMFLIEALEVYLSEEVYDADKQYVLAENLLPVGRLAGNEYVKFGEKFALARPD